MNYRASHLGLLALLVAAVPVLGCGGDGGSPASPAGVQAGLLGNNPDGSTLKATAPVPVTPTNFFRLDDVTPVMTFTNSQALYVNVGLDYEVQILTEGGQPIYTQQVPRGSGQTTHTYPGRLEIDTVYQWRARASYQGQAGPWSDVATFQTTARPNVTPENLTDYLIQFSVGNANWAGCSAGSGTSCFRFVYEVTQSMNPTCDPNSWGLLSKNPGEQQCTLSGCGSLGGEGFGEDIITHGGFSPILLWDVIGGAGAPGATLGASSIPRDARRAGNNWACPWR